MSARILVVDDEPGLLATLAANLELEDFEVITASSGEEALAKAQQTPVDLVLSDVRMPGMSGVELFRKLKEIRPGLPVIIMTAFALEDLIEGALRDGVFTVLPKPFDVEHVIALVALASRLPTVLVVDDDKAVAESTAAALSSIGVRCRAAHGGRDAIELVRSGEVDVCVTDIVMPEMDGAQVVESLRASHPDVTVIVFSGHEVSELMSKAAALGAFACMRKPLTPGDLARTVAKARGQAKRAAR